MGILDALHVPMLAVLVVGLAVALFLNAFRRNELIRRSVLGLVALLFLAAVVAPTFMDTPGGKLSSVEVFRAIGPLAMVVLNVLLVFACVTVVTLLARAVGIPLITVAVVIALVAIAFDLEVAATALLVCALCVTVAIVGLVVGTATTTDTFPLSSSGSHRQQRCGVWTAPGGPQLAGKSSGDWRPPTI